MDEELLSWRRRSPCHRKGPLPPEPDPVTPIAAVAIHKPVRYLVACAIVRDEQDLAEWVAYQFAVGFEHVHLFDNESVIPVRKVLRNWIKDGRVTVECVTGRRVQNDCYTSFLERANSRWVAFFDADEFVLPHNSVDFKETLQAYEKFAGFGVTWKVFGSDGHVIRPSGLVIANYTKTSESWFCSDPESEEEWPQYKSVVDPKRVSSCPNPHYFIYRDDWHAVNENKRKIPNLHSHGPPSVNKVQLNHYMMRSWEDFRLKQTRRGGASGRPRTVEEWDHQQRYCNAVTDTRIQRYAVTVKALMHEYQ